VVSKSEEEDARFILQLWSSRLGENFARVDYRNHEDEFFLSIQPIETRFCPCWLQVKRMLVDVGFGWGAVFSDINYDEIDLLALMRAIAGGAVVDESRVIFGVTTSIKSCATLANGDLVCSTKVIVPFAGVLRPEVRRKTYAAYPEIP
jgi:hypothetical protein